MSTIIDNFEKDKESYKRIQDKDMKNKEGIIRAQNNIDKLFFYIGPELILFTQSSVRELRKKIGDFGSIEHEQQMKF